MRRQFVIGDYTYTRLDIGEGARASVSSWAKNASKTTSWSVPTGYDYVTDATNIYGIRILLFNLERTFTEEYKFIYGESKTYDSSENFRVAYGGASSVTVTAKKALSNVIFDRSVTFYDKSRVNVQANSTSQTSYANIPSTVTDDDGVTANVTDCNYTFTGCSNLVTAPTIPNTAETMMYCFNGCTSMVSAPEIPSGVTNMNHCFYRCVALEGNVVVNNAMSGYSDGSYVYSGMFGDTVKDIFIVNNGSGEANWKGIVSEYANVHYEADDNPIPVVSNLTATRVSSSSSTTFEATGLYAYIQATVMVYEVIPVWWTNELKGTILKDNGTTETVTWQPPITGYPANIHCWIYLGDTSTHTISLQISDSVKDNGVEVKSQSSAEISKTISKSYALVDYYHDDVTDTEGMSIGKYAENADLLDVDMPTRFRQGLSADTDITVGGDIVADGHALFNLDEPVVGEISPIQIKQSDIDSEGADPSENTYRGNLFIYDDSGKRIGYIESVHFTDGNIGNQLGASREVNGSMVYNNIRAEVAPDGTLSYGITSPTAFRKTIGLNLTTETKQSLNNTIAAGGTKTITFDLTSSGKTPIAIRGWNVNNSSSGGQGVSLQNVYSCMISGDTGTLEVRNTWTSQAKVDFYLYVLYMGS